jgi:hypothetical protein
MSFVSIIATEKVLSVMSDGRVNIEGAVIQEDYQKFTVLGDNQGFVAITGAKEAGEQAIEIVKQFHQGSYSYFAAAQEVQKLLIRDIPHSVYPHLTLNMAVGGLAEGQIEFYTLSNKNQSVQDILSFAPKGDDISYAKLESNEIIRLGIDLTPVLIEFLRQKGYATVEQLKEAQSFLNDYVAKVDKTVNTTTFHFYVESHYRV